MRVEVRTTTAGGDRALRERLIRAVASRRRIPRRSLIVPFHNVRILRDPALSRDPLSDSPLRVKALISFVHADGWVRDLRVLLVPPGGSWPDPEPPERSGAEQLRELQALSDQPLSGEFVDGRLVRVEPVDTTARPTPEERAVTPVNRGVELSPTEREFRRFRRWHLGAISDTVTSVAPDPRNPIDLLGMALPFVQPLRLTRIGNAARVQRAGSRVRELERMSRAPRLTSRAQAIRRGLRAERSALLTGNRAAEAFTGPEADQVLGLLIDRLLDARARMGLSSSALRVNLATAAVRVNGEIRIVHQPVRAAHSEEWLIGAVREIQRLAPDAEVRMVAILSERRPCSHCVAQAARHAPQIGDTAMFGLTNYTRSSARNAAGVLEAIGQ